MTEKRGNPGPRREVGSKGESRKHPPETDDAGNKSISPAAHGKDKVPTEDAQEEKIDDESMYEKRPAEDKNQSPSSHENP